MSGAAARAWTASSCPAMVDRRRVDPPLWQVDRPPLAVTAGSRRPAPRPHPSGHEGVGSGESRHHREVLEPDVPGTPASRRTSRRRSACRPRCRVPSYSPTTPASGSSRSGVPRCCPPGRRRDVAQRSRAKPASSIQIRRMSRLARRPAVLVGKVQCVAARGMPVQPRSQAGIGGDLLDRDQVVDARHVQRDRRRSRWSRRTASRSRPTGSVSSTAGRRPRSGRCRGAVPPTLRSRAAGGSPGCRLRPGRPGVPDHHPTAIRRTRWRPSRRSAAHPVTAPQPTGSTAAASTVRCAARARVNVRRNVQAPARTPPSRAACGFGVGPARRSDPCAPARPRRAARPKDPCRNDSRCCGLPISLSTGPRAIVPDDRAPSGPAGRARSSGTIPSRTTTGQPAAGDVRL